MSDLKTVYQAPNLNLAELNLDKQEVKWGKNYTPSLYSWEFSI